MKINIGDGVAWREGLYHRVGTVKGISGGNVTCALVCGARQSRHKTTEQGIVSVPVGDIYKVVSENIARLRVVSKNQ